ncbi:MAG: DUF4304 domain-containing protein [Tepidiformaceae bacterium]
MDRAGLTRQIARDVWPFLAEQGFVTSTGRSAWRHLKHRVDVINFQSVNWAWEGSGQAFTINLGIFFICVPDLIVALRRRDDVFVPEEWMCHLRRCVPPPGATGDDKDVWHVPEGLDATQVVEVLGGFALPWLHHYRDVGIACDLVGRGDAVEDGCGNNPSPHRSLVTGFLALAARRHERAIAHLHAARESGSYEFMDATLEAAIREAASRVRRRVRL